MKYTQYTIKTTTKDADLVSVLLMDVGICDVQIENNVQLTDEELNQMYADFKKELPEDDGSCDVIFYREEETSEDGAAFREELKSLLEEAPDIFGIDPVSFTCKNTDSANWENNWKEFFKPFRVDQILIAPTWETIPESADVLENKGGSNQAEELSEPEIIIRIDPGMAFGTGTHETTRLCLRGLTQYIQPGDRVLDLGCGSGILGIGAIKLGAGSVTSVDIDEQAVKVAIENYEVNQVPAEKSIFFTGDVVSDEELKKRILQNGTFDVVAVNILAEVIAQMLPTLDQYLKTGGILITSGILQTREELIKRGIEANPNLELVDVVTDGDWVRITAQKK